MEALPGKPLTLREKEKLKEQLAYLKREYSKTFQRLQRAERAERVKNNVKKRTAENNEFEESISQTPPEASERLLGSAFLEPSTEKATLVGLEPKVLVQGDSLPENSGSEWSTPEAESRIFCPIGPRPERKLNRLSRSGAKTRQRVTLALGGTGESARDGLQEIAGYDCGCDTASTGSSGSPTFKRRCSTLESDQSIPNTASTTKGGSHGVVVAAPETSGQDVCVGASSPLSNAWRNRVPSLNSQGKEDVFANPEGSTDEKPIAPDDEQCRQQVSVQAEKEQVWVCEEEPSSAAGLVRVSEAPCGSGTLEARSHYEETKNLDLDNKETSSFSKAGEMGQGSQGKAGPPHLDEALPVAPMESSLSSCTVVEGLLFPVEYYVRTTRRMSRCQREVDLAAVLQGQLGRRKKGHGASRKEKGDSPGLPIQEPAGSECQLGTALFPSPGTCVGSGCDAASLLQPLPPSNALGRGRRGRRSRGRAGRRAAPGASSELTASKDHCCLVSCESEGQGAALPVGASGILEARPTEPTLAAGRHSESESGLRSCTIMTATDSAVSCIRPLEVSSNEVPCPERNTWEFSGTELLLPDEAPLPLCKPVDAAQKNEGRGAPSGGKGSSLLKGSQGHPEPLEDESESPSQKHLPSLMHPQEFHLPGEEHVLPEPESCAIEQVEVFHSAQSVGSLQSACPAAEENLGGFSLEEEPPRSPPVQRTLHRKGEVLLSPTLEGVATQLESQLPTPVFPLVGATPASQPLPGVSPLQVKGSGSKPEDGTRWSPKEAAGVGLKESPSSAGLTAEHSKESAPQIATAVEDVAKALPDSQREGNLQMTAELKDSSSSCSVDLSAMWWETAGSVEFCIAVACEASVSLWRCLEASHWAILLTWHFVEVPISQIVPLPDVHSVLCVALGGWEIAQIRFLFQSSEDGSPEQSQVKAGDIKAFLGLKDRRLVVSCGSLLNQTVEVVFFSEGGRIQKRQSLMPPHENILTFAEVDGMPDALVGLTAANCVVVWNLKTRQLLRKIPVGHPDPASVCHKAFSDSGLLFVVLSHPHAEESEADRTTAFQVVALNPKTARSAGVARLSLPPGVAGRYMEGNVRGTSAATVLTSGNVVVWDLLLGQCTAVLPPSSEGSWSLIRWSVADDCLLARRTDGSIYLYSYTAKLPYS